jgi:hypothetical protein
MKLLTQETVLDFEVEDYIHLLKENKRNIELINRKIHNFSLKDSDKEKALQFLQFAIERIDKSLDIGEVLLLLFIPFGFFRIIIGNSYMFNVWEESRLGFVNRVNQFYLVSIIGLLMYTLIIPSLYYLFK